MKNKSKKSAMSDPVHPTIFNQQLYTNKACVFVQYCRWGMELLLNHHVQRGLWYLVGLSVCLL